MAYYGKETVVLANPAVTIEALKEGGPRVVRILPGGTEVNLLAEAPEAVTETAWGPYHFLGGHRLWHAPEASPRSYEPDDRGVKASVQGGEMLLQGPVEAHTGIQKIIRIVLDSVRPLVHVEHTLVNHNVWPVEMAAWAITQMHLGGTGILPVRAPGAGDGLLPDRQAAFWPYSDLEDPRFQMRNDLFLVEGRPSPNAFKVGAYNPLGWVAYLFGEYLFVKRFNVVSGRFADFGCNAEIFVKDMFLEIESQGPLTVVEPGASVIHTEEWELIKVGLVGPEEAARRIGE